MNAAPNHAQHMPDIGDLSDKIESSRDPSVDHHTILGDSWRRSGIHRTVSVDWGQYSLHSWQYPCAAWMLHGANEVRTERLESFGGGCVCRRQGRHLDQVLDF